MSWCCCNSQPAPLRPDLLCNRENWREAESGGYRLRSLNVYFQPLFLIVWRSWVDIHICHWLLAHGSQLPLSSSSSRCPHLTSWVLLLSSRSKVREGAWHWEAFIKCKQPLLPVPRFCFSLSGRRTVIKALHVFYKAVFQPGGRNSALRHNKWTGMSMFVRICSFLFKKIAFIMLKNAVWN